MTAQSFLMKVFGIQSESKKMETIGAMMAEGFTSGINKGLEDVDTDWILEAVRKQDARRHAKLRAGWRRERDKIRHARVRSGLM